MAALLKRVGYQHRRHGEQAENRKTIHHYFFWRDFFWRAPAHTLQQSETDELGRHPVNVLTASFLADSRRHYHDDHG